MTTKIRDPHDDLFLEPYERLNARSQALRARMMELPEGDPERERLGDERVAIVAQMSRMVARNPAGYFAVMKRELERQTPPRA